SGDPIAECVDSESDLYIQSSDESSPVKHTFAPDDLVGLAPPPPTVSGPFLTEAEAGPVRIPAGGGIPLGNSVGRYRALRGAAGRVYLRSLTLRIRWSRRRTRSIAGRPRLASRCQYLHPGPQGLWRNKVRAADPFPTSMVFRSSPFSNNNTV
ncbi:hypothetical protein THAOC_08580, partial [Thalassiosira oceanica]